MNEARDALFAGAAFVRVVPDALSVMVGTATALYFANLVDV
jgi:hypothetical protein